MVALPPAPLQTRMCGAASMLTAMARPSVLMPISAAETGSACSCSRRPGVGEAQQLREGGHVRHGVVFLFLCCAW